MFGSNLYWVGVVFVNTCSILLCFHRKFVWMHEGYVLWGLKLQNLKQIKNYIMLKYYCVIHRLQLYDIILVLVSEWYASCYHICSFVLCLTSHTFWPIKTVLVITRFSLMIIFLHLVFIMICMLYVFLLLCFYPSLLHCIY